MPFKTNADGVFDGFKSQITLKRNAVILQPLSIVAVKPVSFDLPYFITTDGADNLLRPIVTKLLLCEAGVGTNPRKDLAQVTREELRQFFKFVEDNSDANYRTCKQNKLWKEAYGVQNKTFDTYSSKTRKAGFTTEAATYCQKCGIVFPLRNLTIDHQKPQKGGDMEAMLRVFRAAGLTDSTGAGVKNRFIQREVAAKVGGTTKVLDFGAKGDVNARYTLNLKGIIYFTALCHYNMGDEMKQMSMHHIVNLRPMCGSCNSRLGNTNIIFD